MVEKNQPILSIEYIHLLNLKRNHGAGTIMNTFNLNSIQRRLGEFTHNACRTRAPQQSYLPLECLHSWKGTTPIGMDDINKFKRGYVSGINDSTIWNEKALITREDIWKSVKLVPRQQVVELFSHLFSHRTFTYLFPGIV